MREKTLYKVALLSVLAGLAFLAIYAQELDINAVERLDTASPSPEEAVRLEGSITRLSRQEKVTFAEIDAQRSEQMTVVLFTDESTYLQEGDFVEVEGTVEEYEGERELVASRVVKK